MATVFELANLTVRKYCPQQRSCMMGFGQRQNVYNAEVRKKCLCPNGPQVLLPKEFIFRTETMAHSSFLGSAPSKCCLQWENVGGEVGE